MSPSLLPASPIQTRTPTVRLAVGTVVAALLLSPPAASALAQGPGSSHAAVRVESAGPPPAGCTAEGAAHAACSAPGGRGYAWSTAHAGWLGIESWIDGRTVQRGSTTSLSATSTAEWDDRLVFTSLPVGVTPLYLDFYVSTWVAATKSVLGGTESSLSASGLVGLRTPGADGATSQRTFASTLARRRDAADFAIAHWKLRHRVRLPFAELTAFSLIGRLDLAGDIIGYDARRDRAVQSHGSIDALMMVGLQRVRLVGERRGQAWSATVNRVPRLRAHFADGLVPADPAIVPEPGTWVLVATGLAGIGGIAWRRRAPRA